MKSFSCLLAPVRESGVNCLAESLLKMSCIWGVQIFLLSVFIFLKANELCEALVISSSLMVLLFCYIGFHLFCRDSLSSVHLPTALQSLSNKSTHFSPVFPLTLHLSLQSFHKSKEMYSLFLNSVLIK